MKKSFPFSTPRRYREFQETPSNRLATLVLHTSCVVRLLTPHRFERRCLCVWSPPTTQLQPLEEPCWGCNNPRLYFEFCYVVQPCCSSSFGHPAAPYILCQISFDLTPYFAIRQSLSMRLVDYPLPYFWPCWGRDNPRPYFEFRETLTRRSATPLFSLDISSSLTRSGKQSTS